MSKEQNHVKDAIKAYLDERAKNDEQFAQSYAKVELVTPAGTICKVCKKSLKNEMKETMNDEK